MAKIKVGELREVVKAKQSNNIKMLNFGGLEIEVKQHMPILEKIAFASSVYESSVDKEDGLHIVKGNVLDIAFKVFLIEAYTNITLPQHKDDNGEMTTNTIQSYDMLTNSGLYNAVYDAIPESEILDLKMALDNHVYAKQDEYDQRNTIQYVVKDLLEKLIDKIPNEAELNELVKNASEELSKFDPDKLEFLKSAMDWNSGVEK